MAIRKEEKKLNKEGDEIFIEGDAVKSQEAPGEIREKKEERPEPEAISEKGLREEIEKMDVDDSLKMQAQNDAKQIASLKEEEEKLKNLLQIARHKGVIYAVDVAKKMNDPYVLDKFHDLLTEKGFYKKFLK